MQTIATFTVNDHELVGTATVQYDGKTGNYVVVFLGSAELYAGQARAEFDDGKTAIIIAAESCGWYF
jgi:hypothetical protein